MILFKGFRVEVPDAGRDCSYVSKPVTRQSRISICVDRRSTTSVVFSLCLQTVDRSIIFSEQIEFNYINRKYKKYTLE